MKRIWLGLLITVVLLTLAFFGPARQVVDDPMKDMCFVKGHVVLCKDQETSGSFHSDGGLWKN